MTIRGRGESAKFVFTMLGVFIMMTIMIGVGLVIAHLRGVAPAATEGLITTPTVAQALMHC